MSLFHRAISSLMLGAMFFLSASLAHAQESDFWPQWIGDIEWLQGIVADYKQHDDVLMEAQPMMEEPHMIDEGVMTEGTDADTTEDAEPEQIPEMEKAVSMPSESTPDMYVPLHFERMTAEDYYMEEEWPEWIGEPFWLFE